MRKIFLEESDYIHTNPNGIGPNKYIKNINPENTIDFLKELSKEYYDEETLNEGMIQDIRTKYENMKNKLKERVDKNISIRALTKLEKDIDGGVIEYPADNDLLKAKDPNDKGVIMSFKRWVKIDLKNAVRVRIDTIRRKNAGNI